MRPDLERYDEDDTTAGPKFLCEFEIARQAELAAAGKRTGRQDQAGMQASGDGHDAHEKKKGLFDDSEDEEMSDNPDQSELEAANDQKEEQEWKGFADDEKAPAKPDESGLEQSKCNGSVEDEKTDLGEKDDTVGVPDQPGPVRVQDHEATDEKKEEGSTT